jgi:chromosome segregation ATPase
MMHADSWEVRQLKNRVSNLETQLSDERQTYWYRMGNLMREKELLSSEKANLVKQLNEKSRANQVLSSKVSTLEYKDQVLSSKVSTLEYKVTKLSVEKGKVEKQLEDTRKTGVLFMNVADEYQEVVEREIKTLVQELKDTRTMGVMFMNAADRYQDMVEKEFTKKTAELDDTRNASLLFMNVADEYQEEVEKEFKVKSKELNDTRMAGLLFMNAADDYQEGMEKEYKSKMEELKGTRMAGWLLMNAADEYQEVVEKESKLKLKELELLWAQNMEIGMRVTSLESELKVATGKKEELEADVTVKKMGCEVVKGESGKLHLKVSDLEHQLDVEVKKHKMEVCPLEEENETIVKAFNAEKVEKMRESEYIKRIVEEIQADKECVEGGENSYMIHRLCGRND